MINNSKIVDDSQFVYFPMEFDIKWGFPVLAKVAVGSIGTLLLAIVVGFWFLLRRLTL